MAPFVVSPKLEFMVQPPIKLIAALLDNQSQDLWVQFFFSFAQEREMVWFRKVNTVLVSAISENITHQPLNQYRYSSKMYCRKIKLYQLVHKIYQIHIYINWYHIDLQCQIDSLVYFNNDFSKIKIIIQIKNPINEIPLIHYSIKD